MIARITHKLRWPLLGGCAAALVLLTTTALAGSGVGGVFNLGQVNTVDAQTTLTGNPGGNPQLRLINGGTGAALRAESQTGIGVNGTSVSGTGQQGLSQSGIGLLGTHSSSIGSSPGVQGVTQSGDPLGAGVLGRNNGGGPGLRSVVIAGAPPLAVNSAVKVPFLNSDLLDTLDSTAFWKLGGNLGTTPGTDFLGTTDDQALELKVNGQRALRLEPASNIINGASPNVIGGLSVNGVLAGTVGAAIGGGGSSQAGGANFVNNDFGTIGGGSHNNAGKYATIGGGTGNVASLNNTAIGGGAGNTAAALSATVGGGGLNTADGMYATVPGGLFNRAGGQYSFAAGLRAKALNTGSFVWGDSTDADFSSTANDQFLVRATGGARFVMGASTFAATGAALQAENSSGLGEAAWLRVGVATTHAVVSLIKQSSGTGNFLTCWNEAGGSFSGKCHIDSAGTFVAGSDFAESLPARGSKSRYSPGDVLSISRIHPGQVERSHKPFDRALIGVYSTRPGVLGADKGGITRVGKNDVPVAITGIVPVKVSAENGAIYPGDLLTTASLPGRAMNAGLRPEIGTVLGKSIGVLERGQGVIKMLVMPR
jgi:hypothetical protein